MNCIIKKVVEIIFNYKGKKLKRYFYEGVNGACPYYKFHMLYPTAEIISHRELTEEEVEKIRVKSQQPRSNVVML